MNKFYINIIKEALEYQHLLNDWEINFINNIAERGDNYTLSKKEISVLNKISTKVACG